MKKTRMLKKNYEFSRVFFRLKYFSADFICAFILNTGEKYNSLGLAISSKAGKANQRNRIKRYLRENYKNYEEKLKTGYNIIFLWKKKFDIKQASFKDIQENMLEILKKSKILKES